MIEISLIKAFIELTPSSGNLFTATISPYKETEFAAYIVDGSFSYDVGLLCNGDDYADMINISLTSEFSDLTKQPVPLFFFTRSKSFAINLPPLQYSCLDDTKSFAGAGRFWLAVAELKSSTSTSVFGESDYESTKVYVSIPSSTRGSLNASTILRDGSPSISIDSAKYGYDIDSKLGTKSVGTSNKYFSTDDYVFKYSSTESVSSKAIGSLSSNSGQLQHGNAFCAYSSFNMTFEYDNFRVPELYRLSNLGASINIDGSYFQSDGSTQSTRGLTLTPSAINGKNYIFRLQMGEGVLSMREISNSSDTISSKETKGYLGYVPNSIFIVNNGSDLSGKRNLIKSSVCYSVQFGDSPTGFIQHLAGAYLLTVSKSGAKTQLDQGRMEFEFLAAYRDDRLALCGLLFPVIKDDGSALYEQFDVGFLFSSPFVSTTSSYSTDEGMAFNILVLYDDGSTGVSTEIYEGSQTLDDDTGDKTTYSIVPIALSSDGKNVRFKPSLQQLSYEGIGKLSSSSRAVIGMTEGKFAVPENTGTKKIIAVGCSITQPAFDKTYQNSIYRTIIPTTKNSFILISPKT